MQGAQEVGVWVLVAVMLIPAIKSLVDMLRPPKRDIQQPLSVRPDIPGHDRFAPKDHAHPQYLTRDECGQRHAAEERRQDLRAQQILDAIETQGRKIEEHNKSAEERSSKLHQRVDPLAAGLAATDRTLTNHLEDHRAKGQGHAG
jgi:hypothetical protein